MGAGLIGGRRRRGGALIGGGLIGGALIGGGLIGGRGMALY
jgi:hypothetical protein